MNKQVKRGQWIVKLDKLKQCDKCNSYFVNVISYKRHHKTHEKEIKVEIFPPYLAQDEIKENKPRNKHEKSKFQQHLEKSDGVSKSTSAVLLKLSKLPI